VVSAYNALTSDPAYNVIFYSPNLPNNGPGLYTGGNGLYYLISMNYSSAIVPFLRIENVRYVITYDDTPYVTNILNSSGMNVKYLGPSAYLYSNNNTFGQSYGANILLNYSGGSMNYIFAYDELESMGIIPVISAYGNNTLGFNEFNSTVNILSPAYVSSYYPETENVSSSADLNYSGTISTRPVDWNAGIGQGWFIGTNSTRSTNVTISNGTFSWEDHRNVTVDMWYANQTAIGGFFGTPIPDYDNMSATVNVMFQYRHYENFSGNISGFIAYLYKQSPISGYTYAENYFSFPISMASGWTNASFKLSLPYYTKWFSSGILLNGTSNQGTISIRNINTSLGLNLRAVGTSEYNNPLPIRNASMNLPGNGTYYLLLSGSGFINNGAFSSHIGSWSVVNAGHITFNGTFEMNAVIYIENYSIYHYMGNYTVYNQPYSPELRLLKEDRYYEPYYTLNGQTFFYTGFEQNETLVIHNVIYDLYYIYLGIIAYFVVILTLPKIFYKKRMRGGK